jgi:hypothetical protein
LKRRLQAFSEQYVASFLQIASNMPIHQYLMAISLSLYEFAFSIVNLSLTALGSVFRMKTRTREFVWLGFNFLQVCVLI